MDDNLLNNKAYLNDDKISFNLKNENEENEIEDYTKDYEISKKTNFYEELKYKIKYADIIKEMSNTDEDSNYNEEFYGNLLLIPSVIDISNRLATLSALTYCYQISEKSEPIYFISNKLEKYMKDLNNVDQTFFLKIFCRAAFFLQKTNYFYALFYINKCDKLIKNKTGKFPKSKIEKIKNYLNDMINSYEYYIKIKKEEFSMKHFSEKSQKIKKLVDLILEGKNNLDVNEKDYNEKYLYIIPKEWLNKLKDFIDSYIEKTEDENQFIDKVFNSNDIYNYYFNEKQKNELKGYHLYPGPINNFSITSFKDCWMDNKNLDENAFIKKGLELKKDYTLINYKDWNFLNSLFDSTNVIKRKKDNLDLIQLKFILFDKRINRDNKNINMLKQKYIQINKSSTIEQLKNKIINCVNNYFQSFDNYTKYSKQEISFFLLNKDKKELLIEIISSFAVDIQIYESLYIKKIDFQNDNTLNDFFMKYDKKKHILMIEIINDDDINFLIEMDKNYKCSICGTKIKNLNKKYNCELCHYSLFCNRNCAMNSSEHRDLDKFLKKIMEPKFILSDLLSLELTSFYEKGNTYGRLGLNNLGNYSYFNSVFQCLSNTEDLTKYFLNKCFKLEINTGNYYGTKGQFSNAYYKLIKNMWKSEYFYFRNSEECINPKEAIEVFRTKINLLLTKEEQNAHELLLSLLDNLHEDLNRITNKKYMVLNEQDKGETDEQASNRWWDYFKSREDSIIIDLFQGQYKSSIQCSLCQNKSINYDIYMTLGLPIPTRKSRMQIKFVKNNGKYINMNIKVDENVEIKDIILKSLLYVNKYDYIPYIKKANFNQKNHLFNYNVEEVPEDILYNNIQVIEFRKDLKMVNIFDTLYEQINKNNNTDKSSFFDNLKFLQYNKKKNNYELVLYEKGINVEPTDYLNIYVYPMAEINKEGIFFNGTKQYKIISYPVILSLNKKDNLNTLRIKIFKKMKKILHVQYQDEIRAISICYPHFSDKWENFKNKEGICPICNKAYDKNSKFCNLLKNDKYNSILDIINNQKKNMPLILFAVSPCYSQNKCLYSGIELLFEKSNETFETKTNLTIYDSLDLFSTQEILDGENMWFCSKCQKKTKAKKKIEIYRAPYYLIIQLKRFKQKSENSKSILGNKIDTFIEYKETLDLRDFVIGPDKDKSIYNLYGIVFHKKSINKGNHFFSYCKNNNKWLLYDDENFTYINNNNNLINQDAYLLFYKRKNLD